VGCWFGDMRRALAGTFHFFKPVIDHERYAMFLETRRRELFAASHAVLLRNDSQVARALVLLRPGQSY
jgi:hypothetical protein